MFNKKRFGRTAVACAFGAAVGLAQCAVGAFTNNVPVGWVASPNHKDGAYLESFDGASAPTWDSGQVSVEGTNSHAAPLPTRLYTWFETTGSRTNALKLPGSTSFTNKLAYPGDTVLTNVTFETKPVFVDMRVQFVKLEGEPTTDNAKLAIFVSDTNKLHVVHSEGRTTNTWPNGDLLSKWHQLTVRLEPGNKFAVLLDDTQVTNNLTPFAGEAANKLSSIVMTGDGYVDDLYVSHGNPQAYPGTTNPIPSSAATYASEGSVCDWLASLMGSSINAGTTFSGFDTDKMNSAYLLNALGGNSTTATPVEYTFGVSAIDLVSDTKVMVTCLLNLGNPPAGKSGVINGRIRLQGKSTIDGVFADLSPDAITPKYTDFVGGVATYTFEVPSGTKFFKAQIVE